MELTAVCFLCYLHDSMISNENRVMRYNDEDENERNYNDFVKKKRKNTKFGGDEHVGEKSGRWIVNAYKW